MADSTSQVSATKCLLCKERARQGGTICWRHHDQLVDMLDPDNLGVIDSDITVHPSIPVLWALLNPRPGSSQAEDERRAPGFASSPPANLHVVTLRDGRSKSCEVARDGWVYEWDDDIEEYVKNDVWFEPARMPYGVFGHDARTDGRVGPVRVYREQERPPRSIPASISALATLVHETRGYSTPLPVGVVELCVWLHRQTDWITRQDDADDTYHNLRELQTQLRAANGDRDPKPVASCTKPVRNLVTGQEVECGAPLYAPPQAEPRAPDEPINGVPVVQCRSCGEVYDGLAQLRLRVAEQRRAC